jgi:thioredoxin reductase (NADPH)
MIIFSAAVSSIGTSRFDGVAVTGQRIFIVGGGNSAGQAAVFYSGYAAQVIMLVRGGGLTQTMSQYLIQHIHDKANIRVEPYTQVTAVHGDDHLEQITTSSRPPGGPESTCTRDAKALFIMIGAIAKTQWLPTFLERDANGYICTGRDVTTWSLDREPFALETSIPGLFCAGDVRHGSVKRVASTAPSVSARETWLEECESHYEDYVCRGRAKRLLGRAWIFPLRRNLTPFKMRI